MSQSQTPFRIGRAAGCVAIVLVGWFAACEEETAPGPTPVDIEIVSGNDQYSKQGTELEAPIVVEVTLSDGEPGAGVPVRFAIKAGGGTLSRTSATTNVDGRSSVRWTLGAPLGVQEIEVSIADDPGVDAVGQATSANFHCPEEDPTFVQRFFPENDLFLFTRASSVTVSGGQARAGVVHLGLDLSNQEFDATSFVAFDETVFQAVVRDCAFAENGEFYIAWNNTSADREIAKVAPDRTVTHFATLEGLLGTEITWLEGGVLAGCDEFGPFTVGCRDTLTRYADALYSGTLPDAANYDAVAFDPIGSYLYFIYRFDRSLRRIPLDGYAQAGPTEDFLTLEPDEASGANGMAVHTDGSVYILVDSPGTKSIVKVTSTGTKTTVFDFFTRGAGNAAGIQDDLAIDSDPTRNFLFTLDTLNNVILLFDIDAGGSGQLFELTPDVTAGQYAASNASQGERVGLAVLPGAP